MKYERMIENLERNLKKEANIAVKAMFIESIKTKECNYTHVLFKNEKNFNFFEALIIDNDKYYNIVIPTNKRDTNYLVDYLSMIKDRWELIVERNKDGTIFDDYLCCTHLGMEDDQKKIFEDIIKKY